MVPYPIPVEPHGTGYIPPGPPLLKGEGNEDDVAMACCQVCSRAHRTNTPAMARL